jgi:hypothetical protein
VPDETFECGLAFLASPRHKRFVNSNGRKTVLFYFALACVCLLSPRTVNAADKGAPPRIDVILWFDTEDYLLPADDDASKRLAEMLTARRIPATFKIVGEKARTLERRGRRDVIAALKKHTIAYHSDFHSVHPAPSEYLADCGLLDGIANSSGVKVMARQMCGAFLE